MKHYLNFFVLFLVFTTLLAIPHLLSGEATKCYDLTTDSEFYKNKRIENLKPLRDYGPRQHMVLWDTTHGEYLGYGPNDKFTELVAQLADSGYTIVTWGNGVNNIDLSPYDVIVIAVGSNWYSVYTQVEVDSLLSYYNQEHKRVVLTGDMNFCDNIYNNYVDNIPFTDNVFDWLATTGGILIMGENTNCPNVNINPVANAFHMTAGIMTISPADLYFSNFAPHPIFNGIAQVYYRLAGSLSATSPAQTVAWTDNNEPTITLLDESVGIEDEYKVNLSKIQIMPNPFRRYAIVNGIGLTKTIRIYDVTGSLVEETKKNIVGNSLKEGIYYVKIEGHKPYKIIKFGER